VPLGLWLGLAAVGVLVVFLVGNVLAQRSTRAAMQSVGRVENRFEPLARLAHELDDAVVAYERAASNYLKSPIDENATAMAVAGAQLEVALAEYRRIGEPAPVDARTAHLGLQIADLQRAGETLVAAQQQRARLIASYWTALERLRNRIAGAGGSGLDVGDNNVIARKSLAELSKVAAALGNDASAQFTGGGERAAARAARSERSFRQVLARYLQELGRSPGAAWLDLLEEDFATLTRARRTVARADVDSDTRRRAFSDAAALLRADIREGLQQPAWRALSESAHRARVTAQDAEQTIGVVSVVVLAMVLCVWAAAAWGITRPVRRLIAGTRSLASGALETRVPGGGVRELDELAAAFNHMGEQLAGSQEAVRSQQLELEMRVEERTRQLHHLAHHDPLTELPNRRQLFAHLQAALAQAHKAGRRLAVLFIDLDNFKTINDSLGHEFGDRVLRVIGARLRPIADTSDFIGRLGGDEFTVVLGDAGSAEDVERRVGRLIAEFQTPLEVDGRELMIGISVGVAAFPDHANDAEALLRAADSALFRAKELGRNRFCIYDPEMFRAASRRFQTEQSLRRAIDSGDLLIHYQPEVSLEAGAVTLVEALLRWRRTNGKIAPAADFLAVAEQSGIMLELSEWVLVQAGNAVREWRRDGWPQARVAVNASAQQFLGGNFVASIERLLRVTGLPPECLELELTETVLQTGAGTIESLHALRLMGVSVALDDFGVGFSSLTSIARLPIDRVKLDRSLVAEIDSNPRSAAIARSIVSLCRGLGLQVTAEGVERPAQLEFLSACGDIHVQGYLIARPAPAERVVELIQATRNQLALLGPALSHAAPDETRDKTGKLVTLHPRRP
jgi:diguanylate cyclase (GGDEF)-like protein